MLSASAKDKYFCFFLLGLVKMGFCFLLEWVPCSRVERFHIAFQRNDYAFSSLSSKFHGENQTVLQTHYLSEAQ